MAYNLSGAPRSASATTVDRQFARMNRSRRCELAGIKMESLDADNSRIELGIRLQKLAKRLRGHIAATRERNVRMPGAKLGVEPGSERGFLHPLVNLKQVRVRLTDANPNNFRRALCRKRSDANNGQKEGAELDCAESLPECEVDIVRDIAVESERQMHLRRIGPPHTANVWIKGCKQLAR